MNVLETILKKLPRMWDWILLTIALFVLVWYVAPQQLQIVLYKTLLVSLAAVLTFWIDRSLFARMSDRIENKMKRDIVSAGRVLSRALIFLGCVLGMSLGL